MKNKGFTLVELLIAMIVGLVVLSGAVAFAINQTRIVEAQMIRDEVYRNARYVNVSLARDLQRAGVGIESTPVFGVLSLRGDTIVILQIPHRPAAALPYDLLPPGGSDNPLSPGGTCGSRCLDLLKSDSTFEILPGSLARLQVSGTRRLILVSDVQHSAGSVQLSFTAADSLIGYPAGLSGGLLLDRFETFVQEIEPIIYYVSDSTLMRAERLNADGSLAGEIVAFGVQAFDVNFVFADGREASAANPNDADVFNDYDDVIGVRINVRLSADRADQRVSNGSLFARDFEWFVAPRNLRYARNR